MPIPNKVLTFAPGFETGCSAVRLAHLLWEQGVEGSNPFTPTEVKELQEESNSFFIANEPAKKLPHRLRMNPADAEVMR